MEDFSKEKFVFQLVKTVNFEWSIRNHFFWHFKTSNLEFFFSLNHAFPYSVKTYLFSNPKKMALLYFYTMVITSRFH